MPGVIVKSLSDRSYQLNPHPGKAEVKFGKSSPPNPPVFQNIPLSKLPPCNLEKNSPGREG